MSKNKPKNHTHDRVESFIKFFKSLRNPHKKGELSEMILKDDFYNKNMTEEEYQKEQKEWLEKIKKKKKSEKS